ncbi:MAG: ABC transporter ATP-binding protein [Chloroflexota bacterium]|nr:MAG: ABC transporter ATP-binding protein [Chloroflexota bacterium]
MSDSWHLTGRLLGLLRGYRWAMAIAVVCGLLYTFLSLVPPLVVREVIRRLVDQSDGSAEQLGGLALLLAGAALLRGSARFIEAVVSHVVAYRILHDLAVQVYAHLQRLPQRFFADRRSGELAGRIVIDSAEVEAFLAHAITQTTQAVLVPLAMIAVLFVLNWQLALIALVPLPFAGWLAMIFWPPARRRWQRMRAQLGELGAVVQEGIAGVTVIKAFGRERERLAVVDGLSARVRDEIIAANRWTLVPISFLEALAGVGVALVIWQGGVRAYGGALATADLFVFVFYVTQIYQPLLHLTALNEAIQNAMAAAERVFAVLDAQPDVVDAPHASAPSTIRWTVAYDQVVFSYDPLLPPVLRGLSFEVGEGETVALVGMTGAGKSTTSSLLPRFYDVQAGAIRIGGHDVRDLPVAFVRGSVAMVLQDVFLFHGTVRDNLLLGRPEATDAELIAAARAANAHDFIVQISGGYDGLIGERGARLSGGEKQRISIARALLKDAPILVLDEATSAIDAETEELIQEALARLTANRTTLVIAHRLSTIRTADRIVVLESGRAAEIGTHDELVTLGGLYAAMERAHRSSRQWTVPGHQHAPMGLPPAATRAD